MGDLNLAVYFLLKRAITFERLSCSSAVEELDIDDGLEFSCFKISHTKYFFIIK